jgi:ribosomal protein S18 acetylase RimI-like enzyme
VIRIQRLTAEDWRLWRELRLEALAEAPYAFCSTLASWQGAGDTEARWRRRLSDAPLNLVAWYDEEPAGMASGTAPETETGAAAGAAAGTPSEAEVDLGLCPELISMWVAPFARGTGVADALITAVSDWAVAEYTAPAVTLSVREGNTRAIGLYQRHGFVDIGRSEDGEPGEPPERRMVRLLPTSERVASAVR